MTVCPELVEGLFFFCATDEEQGQGFDKLSPNGSFASAQCFADGARQLAGYSGAILHWTPDVFWRTTPEELAAIFAVIAPEVPEGIDLAALMERFPDG